MERYQVELTDFPGEQIAFVKALRIVGNVSLADANEIYVHASNAKRTVLVAGIEKHVADHIAAAFTKAHIRAVVKIPSIASPMICRPQANTSYIRNGLRSVVSA